MDIQGNLARSGHDMSVARVAALAAVLLLCGCEHPMPDGAVWRPVQARPDGLRVIDSGHGQYPAPAGRLGDAASAAFALVFGLGLLGLVVGSAWLARVHGRRARGEERVDPVAPLRAGPFVLVGTVEADERGGPPVSIRMRQRGREWRQLGSWEHEWREIDREVAARPFVVRRDDGVRVEVEPTRVALQHVLSRTESGGEPERRTRLAELSPGSRVFISGELVPGGHGQGSAYRDPARAPRLLPPRRAALAISTRPPGHEARRRARFHRIWAVVCAVLFLGLLPFSYGPWALSFALGRRFEATCVEVRQGDELGERDAGDESQERFEVRLEWVRDGERQRGDFRVSDDVFICAQAGCARFVVLDAKVGPLRVTTLGSQPRLGVGIAVVLVVVGLLTLLGWSIIISATRPWYAQRRHVEGGSGRLH